MQHTQKERADRSQRFEFIAACEPTVLVDLADMVLQTPVDLTLQQEPTPKLVMQQVEEPVEHQAFNLGEVLVTVAEVSIDGEDGFAMVPGKAEHGALAGAVVDAAVACDHPESDNIEQTLREQARERRAEREREWGKRRETRIDFSVMEDET